MALYTKSQFLELLGNGKKFNWLGQYITRKKLRLREDGMIDDTDPTNYAFVQKWRKDNTQAPPPPQRVIEVPTPAPRIRPKFTAPKAARNIADDDYDEDGEGLNWDPDSVKFDIEDADKLQLHEVEIELRRSQLVKTYHEARRKKIDADKAEGRVIDVELVERLILMYGEHIYNACENEIRNRLDLIAAKYKMSNEDTARYRKEIVDGVNNARRTAHSNTVKDLANFVAEFAEQRGRGEKK